ncbi:helix-turn-helix domain-containing protein [Streptococcus canis]|uniref:helix-turn-helix domain-containing protein n=1 Tax=Streptococcus canis TaxID=1329 RepID=UPI001142C2D8|nr:helix-turn-helix domain-containing protein [Streptococcus canis]QKG76885.1 helix-turn-helix domain-containing protein [Streptococcus canis]GEE06492.1 DNA-binding phage protein [Streptococcus canis]GFG41159.1 DNA-binding phage protein [Streptococcus canis]GMX35329.1 helix-turn-helix transcriptional regulator [Streptococcus canis]GMX39202.1 helix-turn-helix transcriptional regulator [Streptococcus canis]
MFPERLKELRKNKNLTQKDMANHFGTSQPSYQAWESGKRTPNSESLDKIASFFNVSTDYLLGNTEIKNPNKINLSEFEILFRKTSDNLTDKEKIELEHDLKKVLAERQKIIDERKNKKGNQ